MLFILEDNDERIAGFRNALGDQDHHMERTVPEALVWLRQHKGKVTLYSLDNDLVLLDYEGDDGEVAGNQQPSRMSPCRGAANGEIAARGRGV